MHSDIELLAQRLQHLEQDNAHLQQAHAALRRRFQALAGLALAALILTLLLAPGSRKAIAQQTGGLPELAKRVTVLEAAVANLQNLANTQQTQINTLTTNLNNEIAARQQADTDTLNAAKAYTDQKVAAETNRATTAETNLNNEISAAQAAEAALQSSVSAVQAKTAPLSLVGTDLTISGVNVHIVNGLGATNGNPGNPRDTTNTSVNGLGNLTIGYNALRNSGFDARTGSHNLIVGDFNNYSSYGGLVVGSTNEISAPFAAVSGGEVNTVSGLASSVSGGSFHIVTGSNSSISGGFGNTLSGNNSSVSGGVGNIVNSNYSSISGGGNGLGGIFLSTDFSWAAGGVGSGTFHSP